MTASPSPRAAAGRLADRRGISRSARRALQWAPPLLFGLYAGVLTDRLNRKLIVVVTNVIRVLVLFVLAASIFIGFLSIALVLVAMFLLGTAETFADNASTTVLLDDRRGDLAVANSRLQTGFVTVNQLAGPPISSPLRRRDGMAIPAAGGPTSHECDAHLRLVLPNHGRDVAVSTRLRADIAEGFRWVWHHAAIRTLVLTIFTFNITFGARGRYWFFTRPDDWDSARSVSV